MFIIYFAFIKISERIFHELSNDELNLRFVKVSSENISKGSIFYSSKTVKSRYQSSQQQWWNSQVIIYLRFI